MMQPDRWAFLLNRILHLTDRGLHYEADPRHVEMLARSLGLDAPGTKHVVTPGVKLNLEQTPEPDESMEEIVSAI